MLVFEAKHFSLLSIVLDQDIYITGNTDYDQNDFGIK